MNDAEMRLESALLDLKQANIIQDQAIRNESLEKSLKKLSHEMQQLIQEKNAKLESQALTINNLEQLCNSLKSLKESSDQDSRKILEARIIALENSILSFEQNEMNLKRQIQTQQMEIGDLKLNIQKMDFSNINNSKPTAVSEQKLQMNGFDEETTELLHGLLAEIEELKKDKNDLQEKALERLTEKEIEIMDLRQEMDQMIKDYREEISELINKISELSSTPAEEGDGEEKLFSQNNSFNNDDESSQHKISQLKYELELKTEELSQEKQRQNFALSTLEARLNLKIAELTNEISSLKLDIENSELDKLSIQKNLETNMKTNDSIYSTIDEYQNKLRLTEEQKEKIESNLKDQIHQIKREAEKYEELSKSYKDELDKIKENMKSVLTEKKQAGEDITKMFNETLANKENIIKSHNDKAILLNKEIKSLKSDLERIGVSNEKMKKSYNESIENMRIMKDEHIKEMKQMEDKLQKLEEHFDEERSSYLLLENNNSTNTSSRIPTNNLKKYKQENTLDEVMNSKENCDMTFNYEQENISLKTQISQLKQTIKEQMLTLTESIKEFEHSKLVNEKLKEDIKEIKQLYESQIKSLQMNSSKSFAQRTSMKVSLRSEETDLTMKQVHTLSEMFKEISQLKAENKYLTDSIEVLKKDKDRFQTLRQNDILFYQEQLQLAEQSLISTKVAYASFAFQSDEELNKLRSLNKKYKDRLNALNAGSSRQK